ncbi:glycosyltransferase family 2 protein [Candidatus Poribacteria bacterium]|nr:glycosyltransferase family 2 protein [Candidatus Poribacteria bacterium]
MKNSDEIYCTVVSPMFNEEANIASTVAAIEKVMARIGKPWELILVNDGSTDHTQAAAEKICREKPFARLLSYMPNRGRGKALRTGFSEAKGRFIITIESDLSWDASLMPEMLRILEAGEFDLVLASPYTQGGAVEGVPPARLMISRIGNTILSMVVPGNFRMVTQMFRAYRREVLDSLELESDDKEIHLEILSKALALGYRAREIPAVLRSRRAGRSKFNFGKTAASHLAFSYFEKPILLFGLTGFGFLALALIIGLYLVIEFSRGRLNPDRPLMTLLVILIVGGLQFVSLGLVGTQIVQLRKEVYRIQMENRRLERQITRERG